MKRGYNGGTQPFKAHQVFNNWDVVTTGWYLVGASSEVKRAGVKAVEVAGQRLAIFRSQDGHVRALDAFCPHMGADLANGAVRENTLQCFFHQWRFDGGGHCVEIPCSKSIPRGARVPSYATQEKYGFIWVWPEAEAAHGVAEFPELEGQDVWYQAGTPVYFPCHHHVCMINGLDAQHLKTVHKLSIDMQLDVVEDEGGRVVDYTMRGQWSDATPKERLMRRCFGPDYGYRMRYVDATVGLLTTMLDAKWFGTGPTVPTPRMIFAFTPLSLGRTRAQPIFVAPKRTGAAQWLGAQALLQIQRMGNAFLEGEDGAVYDNIRFQTRNLLPIDDAVARYVRYVNGLPLSSWSTTHRYTAQGRLSSQLTPPP